MPNALHMALQPSREAQAVIEAAPPFRIVRANETWMEKKGVSAVRITPPSLTSPPSPPSPHLYCACLQSCVVIHSSVLCVLTKLCSYTLICVVRAYKAVQL